MATIIDDFEDNDISEYGGDTGTFATQDSVVKNGTYALEATGVSDVHRISSTSNLNAYLDQGETARYYFRVTDASSGFAGFMFGTGGETADPEANGVRVEFVDGELQIGETGGKSTLSTFNTASVSTSADTWYEVRLRWETDDTMTATIYDDQGTLLAHVIATPSNVRQDGGVGWSYNDDSTGDSAYYDTAEFVETPAAASNLSVTQGSENQLDLSWDDNSSVEDGFAIYRAQTSGSDRFDYTQVATVSSGTTTYTDTGLEDGEQYYYRVTATNSFAESPVSNEDSAKTELPAPTLDSLDASVEDEITDDYTLNDNSSDGNVEILRSQDGSTGSVVATVTDLTASSYTDTGLTDGQKYYYTVRRNTDHVTDVDSGQQSATTVLPDPGSFTVTSTSGTTLDFSWNDNSDNANENYVVEYSTDGGSTWSSLSGDLGADATSYTDSTLAINTPYDFRVKVATDHATSYSSTVTQTNYLKRRRTNQAGDWYLEVEHGTTNTTHRPRLLDDPQRVPSVNGLPKARIPVPRDDKWTGSSFEGATVHLFYKGQRQPIDELASVETRPDKVILHCRGGVELLDRIQREYDAEPIHTAAEDIITTETTYTANVDAPTGTISTNEQMEAVSSTTEFENNIEPSPIASDVAAEIANGEPYLLKSCFTTEGENYDRQSGTNIESRADYSNDPNDDGVGDAVALGGNGNYVEYDFTPEYDIPESRVAIAVRLELTDSYEVTASLNGDSWVAVNDDGGTSDVQWADLAVSDFGSGSYSGGDLSGGTTYTLRLEATSTGGSSPLTAFDVVAPRDSNYSYTDDNSVDSNNALEGPQRYPDQIDLHFEAEPVVTSVSGGRVEATLDDTSNNQALHLSNDDGASYKTKNNASTFETDFAELGPSITFRVTLSRYGSQSTTPTTGINGQALQDYTLYADIDNTPLVVDQRYDGTILSILQQLADLGDHIFAYERDHVTQSIEWTQPGARSSDADPATANYTSEKDVAAVHEQVGVYGSSQTRRAEQVTANHGTYVDLEHQRLQEGKEVVYDPSDGTQYNLGPDYEMDYQDGRIKTISTGAISDGQSIEMTYPWLPYDEYTVDGAANPTHPTTVTVPAAATDQACGQAAYHIVQQVKDPLFRTTVTLPTSDVGWSVVEDLDLSQVPTNGNRLDVQQIEATPSEVVVQLGSRQSLDEVVGRINTKLQSVSRRL